MFFIDLLFALIFALILSAVFIMAFRRKDPWGRHFIFFVIIFLAAWAGGVWLKPIGPPLWNVYWMSFLLVGLLFAILLAGTGLPKGRSPFSTTVSEEEEEAEEKITIAILGAFFWIFLVALAVFIIVHYV